MKELWADIRDYEGCYQVSNFGRVKSLPRAVRRLVHGSIVIQRIDERILKPQKHNSKGSGYYLQVSLSKNGRTRGKLVHILVAEAFVPNPDGRSEVNHIDEDKTNNRSDNLEWTSHIRNIEHSMASGRHVGRPPTKRKRARSVARLFDQGLSQDEIAITTGVTKGYVASLIKMAYRLGYL